MQSSGPFESIEGIVASHSANFGLGVCKQMLQRDQTISVDKVTSTDPPYYDNIGYADLSDFFYVWFRRSLQINVP